MTAAPTLPTRYATRPRAEHQPPRGASPTGKVSRLRAGGRVGPLLLDGLVAAGDAQHRALGAGLDRAAAALERAAEAARWLAALTRACP